MANPVANPKGLALEEVVVTPSSSNENPGNAIDPAYPTEPNAVRWRKMIDVKGIASLEQLAQQPGLTANQAQRMWLAAFPDSRAA